MHDATERIARQHFALFGLMVCLCLTGCSASANYRHGVAESFPVVADRLDRYDQDAQLRGEVVELRAASADAKAVTFNRASAAWSAVEPDYRSLVGGDPALSERRKADWAKTADLLNELHQAERDYQKSLGILSSGK